MPSSMGYFKLKVEKIKATYEGFQRILANYKKEKKKRPI